MSFNKILNKSIHVFVALLAMIYFLSSSACIGKKEREDIFLQYLRETFHDSIVKNEKVFVLIPCLGCSGCDQSVYSIFTNHFLNQSNIVLIICDPVNKRLLSPTLKAHNVKYDFLAKMADYDFGYGYPICFVMKNNTVVDKYTISLNRIKNLKGYLDKFGNEK